MHRQNTAIADRARIVRGSCADRARDRARIVHGSCTDHVRDRARIVHGSCADHARDRARIVHGSCASRVVENLAWSGHKNGLGPNCGGMARGYGKFTLLAQHTCAYRVVEGLG